MIPSSVRIYVCVLPEDMCRSFDGLALARQEVLGKEPKIGAVFCFINKRGKVGAASFVGASSNAYSE